MKTTEIIRSVLDLIDAVDQQQEASPEVQAQPENRFKQILDLITAERSPNALANAPQEAYATISAVTTDAGGGVNGPKHPHDLRVKDPSMHPGQQEF